MKLSMWKKPWTMKEGFLIGGGLVVIGLMVQLCFGAVPWSAIAWPLNGLLFGALLALTVIYTPLFLSPRSELYMA